MQPVHVAKLVAAHDEHNWLHLKQFLLESRVKPGRQVSQVLVLRQYEQPAGQMNT